MNWIISKSRKLAYHTNLLELTKPIKPYLVNYQWVFSDVDFFTDKLPDLPINFDLDYFILSAGDFQKVAEEDVQIIWGALLAIPVGEQIQLNEHDLPFVEGNEAIWTKGNIQLPNAEIEIDCFDSSYTIIKFTKEEMSKAFKEYFPEAVDLDEFNKHPKKYTW